MQTANPLTSFTWEGPLDIGSVPMRGIPEKQGWAFSRHGWLAARMDNSLLADDVGAAYRRGVRPLSAHTLSWMRGMYAERRVPDFPPYFIIEPVSTCSRRCPFCSIGALRRYNAAGQQVRPGMMKWEHFMRLMRECGQHDVYGISLYQLGEPMDYSARDGDERRDIGDMIEAARAVGGFRAVNVSTHGDARNLSRLLDVPPDDVIVSIDGATAATYGVNRPMANGKNDGAFERTLARVRDFLAEKSERRMFRPWVRLQIINNASTRDEVLPFIRQWIQVPGVDDVLVKQLDSMRPWLGSAVVGDEEDAIKAAAVAGMPCQHLWAIGSMTSSGALNACCHDARTELTDGAHIDRTTFYDWWHGGYMSAIRAEHMAGARRLPCAECRERDPWLG